jgi:hypothetical protein
MTTDKTVRFVKNWTDKQNGGTPYFVGDCPGFPEGVANKLVADGFAVHEPVATESHKLWLEQHFGGASHGTAWDLAAKAHEQALKTAAVEAGQPAPLLETDCSDPKCPHTLLEPGIPTLETYVAHGYEAKNHERFVAGLRSYLATAAAHEALPIHEEDFAEQPETPPEPRPLIVPPAEDAQGELELPSTAAPAPVNALVELPEAAPAGEVAPAAVEPSSEG